MALVVAAFGLAALPALAQGVYVKDGEIPVSDPSSLGFGPSGVTVNQSNGDVYAAVPFAPFSAGNSVQRFDAAGASLGGFASDITIMGVAIGPPGTTEDGSVFGFDAGVFDGTADINAFSASGTPTGTPFAVDYEFAEPVVTPQIATLASEGATLILYPNAVDDVIDVFTPDGTLITSWNGTDAATTLVDPTSVAVDNSLNLYVVDGGDGGRVVKINPILGISSVLDATGAVTATVNPVTGDVFVGQGAGAAFHVAVFGSDGAEIDDFGAGDFPDGNAFARRVAVNSDSSIAYVSESTTNAVASPPRLVVYREGAPPPVVATMSPSNVRQTSATLSGTVTQLSVAPTTDCHFEYTDQADFDANGFANADEAPCAAQYPSSGASLVLATANVTGLQPNTAYRYRLVASHEDGGGEGTDLAFTTLPDPPTVATGTATGVGQTLATLAGSVNPNGGTVTSCVVDFGPTRAYGRTKPCPEALGGGHDPVAVSVTVFGLVPGATYHYRLRAASSGGASQAADEVFKTLERPDPCAVSPASCQATDRCVVAPAVCATPPLVGRGALAGTAVVRRGRALVEVHCRGAAGTACKGTLRLSAVFDRPGRERAVRRGIGRATFALDAGTAAKLKVRLSRPARRALAKKRRLAARASGTGLEARRIALEVPAPRSPQSPRGQAGVSR